MNNFTQLVRLGRDAETRYSQAGKPNTSFSGAYDTGYGDKKTSTWIEFVSFQERHGKLELKKGAQIVVNGELYVDKYTAKDGAEKQSVKCIVADFQFAGPKQEGGQSSAPRSAPRQDPFPDDDIDF